MKFKFKNLTNIPCIYYFGKYYINVNRVYINKVELSIENYSSIKNYLKYRANKVSRGIIETNIYTTPTEVQVEISDFINKNGK